ncbi:MAG: hypothetical protein V1861_03005 [Candidatus Micrarchaeota archaeon]
MGNPGFVYGKFFSGESKLPGYSLEDITPSADAGAKPTNEAQQRQAAGHRLLCLRNGEATIVRFWLGYGGSCKYGKSKYRLPDDSPYVYDLSIGQSSPVSVFNPGILNPLTACLHEYLGAKAKSRLVLCAPVSIRKKELEACQLYTVATYISLAPKLVFNPLTRPKTIYEKAVDALRVHVPAFTSVASRLLSASHLRKCLIEGTLAGQRFRIAFNGPTNMAYYYSGVIFSRGQSKIRPLPPSKTPESLSIDMDASWLVKEAKNMAHGTVLPAFCRSILSVGESFDVYTKSLPQSAVSDIKKILSGGFESCISRDFLDFLLFYHSMYIPMLDARHREHSLFLSFAELAGFFNNGFILFVKKNQNMVAGMLTTERNSGLYGKTMGIAAGSAAHTKAGANSAVVYYLIKYAYDNRLGKVDLGLSSPFASDGVSWFKAKWGAKLVADRNIDFLCLDFRNEETKQRFFSVLSPLQLDSLERYEPPDVSSSA